MSEGVSSSRDEPGAVDGSGSRGTTVGPADDDSRIRPPSFELPNVGAGPDPLRMADVVAEARFAVLLLLRDYHCPNCRTQVQSVAERAADFRDAGTAVVAVLPDDRAAAERWQERYDLPFPLLADPEASLGEAYGQPTRFGALGKLHDVIGRMPEAVVIDARGEPRIVETREGSTPGDRPSVDELLDAVDDLRERFVFDCRLVDC